MRTILVLLGAVLISVAAVPAHAQVTDADRAAFKQIIAGQIEAFGADDGERAYSFASPGLQRKFHDPAHFMEMVRRGYAPLYLPQAVLFSTVTIGSGGRPTQRVIVIGPHGLPWLAFYSFERHPHGGWRIAGVGLQPFETDGADDQLVTVLEPNDSDARFVVSHDPGTGRLDVVQIAGEKPADKDYELWLIEGKNAPVSLGLVGGAGDKSTAVPGGLGSALPEGATLAISLEPKGGSTTGAPTGPVVAQGTVAA